MGDVRVPGSPHAGLPSGLPIKMLGLTRARAARRWGRPTWRRGSTSGLCPNSESPGERVSRGFWAQLCLPYF